MSQKIKIFVLDYSSLIISEVEHLLLFSIFIASSVTSVYFFMLSILNGAGRGISESMKCEWLEKSLMNVIIKVLLLENKKKNVLLIQKHRRENLTKSSWFMAQRFKKKA